MHWKITTTDRVRPAVAMLAVATVGLTLAVSASAYGQVVADKETLQLDMAAIKAQADKLRSEQALIGAKLLEEFPQDFEALRIMGLVHSSQGDLEKMVECWRQCVEIEPNRADIRDQMGRYDFQRQSYKSAIEHWKRALAIDSKFPGADRQIGEALLQLDKPEEAKTYLQRAIDISGKDSEAHYLLGEVNYQLRDLQQGKQNYARAVELRPTYKQAYYGLIKTCGQLGERDEAAKYSQKFQELQSATFAADRKYRQHFDELKNIRKEVAVTCIDAGRLYAGNEQLAQAEPLWKRASELDADNAASRNLLGALYLKQRKTLEAIGQFKELARLEPTDPEHYQQLGYLEARLGNLAATERYFKRMVAIAPKNAAGYRSLCKFYLNTKREPELAQQLAATAVKLAPVADSYFVLGWSHAVNGRRVEATAALEKAMQMDPNNPTYRQLHEAVRIK